MGSYSEAIGKFERELKLVDVPQNVIDKAKLVFLDTLGIALASSVTRVAKRLGAKFSLPYSIAVMLVRGRAGLEEFTEAAIRDPAVLDLARKVRYVLDPTIDYPRHFSGHVRVIMRDGSVFEENQPHPRGGFEDPLPPEEVVAKFRANGGLVLPASRLERVPAISTLTQKLIPLLASCERSCRKPLQSLDCQP